LAKTDEVAGAAARAASLQRQLEDSAREGDNLFKQLRRLDEDNPENARSIARYQAEVRDIEQRCAELTLQLQATLVEAEKEKERRASVEAFHAYAASQRVGLEQKTPLERRRLLGSLHTRVRKIEGRSQVQVRFDVRYLPGAVEALSRLGQRGGGRLLNTDTMDHVELVVQHGVSWLEQGFPNEESYDSWVDGDLAEQERAGERYLYWLTETGQSDSDDAYLEWQTIEEASGGQNGASDDSLSPEPPPASDGATSSVLAARIEIPTSSAASCLSSANGLKRR
jgi:hypothetical protein